MKYIKRLLLLLIVLIPGTVFAASGSISVSSANTGVVGNNLNVTVTVSSGTPIGSWEFDISYDRSYLQLTSSTAESGGTHAVGYSTSASGVKSKSYNFTFKVLKSGSTTIRVTSSDAYDMNEAKMSISNGSKTVSLKTQAEIEAAYSPDATLKALSVEGYDITPTFNKDTYEYELEVPNDVERVTINASKNESNASVAGAGEKELQEGLNKFDIVVTAQKGNSLTYTLNITRKELNPIKVDVDNQDYSIVRKKELLPETIGFTETTVTYGEDEIPALYNEAMDLTIVGLKDEEGNIYTYVYNDNKIITRYVSLSNNELYIRVIEITEDLKGLVNREIEIDGYKFNVKALSEDSKQVIIIGANVLNNELSYYLYDINTNTFIPINLEDIAQLSNNNETYKLVIIILFVVIILLLGLNIFKKKDKKESKNNKVHIDEFKEIEVEDEPEIIDEEIITIKDEDLEDDKKKKKEEKKKIKEEKKRLKELEESSNEDTDDLIEEEIKEYKKDKKKKKKDKEIVKEEVKEEVPEEKDDVDDPLNDEDDFMDFWETMEFKVNNKK